jgi:hypothetical protein
MRCSKVMIQRGGSVLAKAASCIDAQQIRSGPSDPIYLARCKTLQQEWSAAGARPYLLRQHMPKVQTCVLYTTQCSGPSRSLRGGSPEAQNTLRNNKRVAPIIALAGASAPTLREAACFMFETYFGPPGGPLGASGEDPNTAKCTTVALAERCFAASPPRNAKSSV